MAVVALCEEHQPLELAPSVGPEVRAYLEETSRKGAWAGPYEGVSLALPCDRLLLLLRPQSKITLLRANITRTPRGWAFNDTHRRLCETLLSKRVRRESAMRIFSTLGCEALEAMSEEALWELRASDAATDAVHTTFQSFARFLDVGRWSQNKLALPVIEAWLALHQRTIPTAAVIARYEGRKSARELWTLWARNALELVVAHATAVSKRATSSLNRCSPRATHLHHVYVSYLKILADHIQSVLRTAGERCDPAMQLTSDRRSTRTPRARSSNARRPSSPSEPRRPRIARGRCAARFDRGHARRRAGHDVTAARVRPGARRIRHRDAAQPARAWARTRVPTARTSHFSALKPALLEFCTALFERVTVPAHAARLGFVWDSPPIARSKRRSRLSRPQHAQALVGHGARAAHIAASFVRNERARRPAHVAGLDPLQA